MVILAQYRIDPRLCFFDASVDPTDARKSNSGFRDRPHPAQMP
jgi:hypothetical protein